MVTKVLRRSEDVIDRVVVLEQFLAAMCCFSRPVSDVSNTRIFARLVPEGRQSLVYSMNVGAPEDLAMILPIPVAASTPEDGVQFINLEEYPQFFADLDRAFVSRKSDSFGRAAVAGAAKSLLKVEEVGSFVASFVPSEHDFERLDPRFRLPNGVWKKLGQYAAFGFAVFQLKKGNHRIHPMAFSFPTAHPDSLFFPTVHIHDGEVHPHAEFDHALFAQTAAEGLRSVLAWEESADLAAKTVDVKKSRGLVTADRHLLRRTLHGELKNEDTWLRVA